MSKIDIYDESLENLFSLNHFKKNLIKICKLLKIAYSKQVEYYDTFNDFLKVFEREIYDSSNEQKISDKDKIIMELHRFKKNNIKDEKIMELLDYVLENDLDKDDINTLKTIIVKKQLVNDLFPTFVTNLFELYNQTMAYVITKNNLNNVKIEVEKVNSEKEEKGKFLI